jgi:aminoglycoside/choline kinase family phosphotransferase
MKKIGIIAVAALLSVSPAFAQTAPSLSPTVGDSSLSTESNSDFGAFMQGFGGADFTASYDSIDAATSVNIIKLSGMANASAASFQDGYAKRESDVAALRARLENNVAVKAALEGNGVMLDQVVAIDATEEGSVTLYINDLS